MFHRWLMDGREAVYDSRETNASVFFCFIALLYMYKLNNFLIT